MASYLRILLLGFLLPAFIFGGIMATVFAWKGEWKSENWPLHLMLGAFLGCLAGLGSVSIWISISRLFGREEVSISFDDKEVFISVMRGCAAGIGFVEETVSEGEIVYKHSRASARTAVRIHMTIQDSRAMLAGPRWHINILAQSLREFMSRQTGR